MSRYLVTDEDGNGHLPVRDSDDGPLNHHLMGAAWAALHGGYRGNKYQGPDKAEAIAKLKALYKSEGVPLPSESATDRVIEPSGHRAIATLLKGLGMPIDAAGKASHEIPICLTGTWVKNGHKFSITPEDLRAMAVNFYKRKNSQLVIDYEHASEQPEVSKGGPIPAAGWIHGLKVGNGSMAQSPDGSILMAQVEWTPEAAQMISIGQYRFFSPAIDWNFPDKQTGHSQGATLTSGALTNHPFLEELPPITLTEAGVLLADVSTGYLDAPVKSGKSVDSKSVNSGGKMASTKLSIEKIKGDDFDGDEFKGAQGHHGIFDGKDYLGHVTADDMSDHVRSCVADGFGGLDDLAGTADDDSRAKGQAGVKGHQQKDADVAELLRDSGFGTQGSEDPREQIRELLKVAQMHQLIEQREASRNLLLTECLVAQTPGSMVCGSFDCEKAKQLLRDKKIGAEDLLDAIEAKGLIDGAVAKGKVLPKDRAFFFEIAFNNPKRFTEYIAGAAPVVAFGSVGIGSTDNMPVDQEVDVETKKLMSEQKISYGKAMKELFKANPALEQRYRAAHRAQPRDNAPVDGLTQ